MIDTIPGTTENEADKAIEEAIARLKEMFGAKSDKALSRVFEMSENTIAMTRKRKILPFAAICNACIKHGKSIDKALGIAEEKSTSTTHGFSAKQVLDISAQVDQIIFEQVAEKSIAAERTIEIYRSLKPILLREALQNGFNAKYLEGMTKGALMNKM